ncbi:hypothetical protein CUMW_185820 [Citrus unshiu]|nr:hypothetical protein CUMW_185820 [Citrus unshiu]
MELSVPARLVHLSISSTSSRRLLVKPKTNLSRKLLPISTQYCSSTRRMNSLTTPRASLNPDGDSKHNNGSASTSSAVDSGRIGEVKRVTKETNVSVKINVDGSGVADSSTCIPFLDHMLDQLASHGLFDVHVRATGDIHIDDHHTNEDVGLAIGTALLQALGDRKGINRFGDFTAPLDEALIHVSLDLSGRPHLNYDLQIPTQRVGTYDTQLVEHFFQSLVNTSGMTLHIRQLKRGSTTILILHGIHGLGMGHSGLCKSNNAALNLKAILDLTLRKKAWKESSLDF